MLPGPQLISFFCFFLSRIFGLSSANSYLVTPDTTSRATTPVEDIEWFDPSRPSLSPRDSIFLPIGKKSQSPRRGTHGTHTRYWFPGLLKHEYIALCFTAQSSYEEVARIRVSPTPDIVTRVFMLFRGVHPTDVGLWAPARHSTRMSSTKMRCALPIGLCSECWNGVDRKSNEYVNHVRKNGGLDLFFSFLPPCPPGFCIGNGSLDQAVSGKLCILGKTLQMISRPAKSKFWPRDPVTFELCPHVRRFCMYFMTEQKSLTHYQRH